MKRIVEIPSSMFSESRSKRWDYGTEEWVEDVEVEYPEELDGMSDGELLDLADNELREDVKYVEEER